MIIYDNDRWLGFLLAQWQGSVIPWAALSALPSAIFACLLCIVVSRSESGDLENIGFHFGADSLRPGPVWAGVTATVGSLVSIRLSKAYGRFWDGTTLLHQMWGEWFDAASCLFAFSSLARDKMPNDVRDFRHTLVRLMSLLHCSALEEISLATSGDGDTYKMLDLGGLDQSTLVYLREVKRDKKVNINRVEVLIHMIQTLIVKKHDQGVLKIPPPILSRVFQTISRGQVNLANCKKIVFTLFPFPLAQLISLLILLYSFLCPFLMAMITQKEGGGNPHLHLTFLGTFLPLFGIYSLQLTARQLEMPFGVEANDLPLEEFQSHMNESMLTLLREETDHIPCTSPNCCPTFDTAKDKLVGNRIRDFIDESHKENHSIVAPGTSWTQKQIEMPAEEKSVATPLQAAPPPQPTPLPPTSLPVVPPGQGPVEPKLVENVCAKLAEANVTALEQALQNVADAFSTKIDDSGKKFQAMIANTQEMTIQLQDLTMQLRQNTDALQAAEKAYCPSPHVVVNTSGLPQRDLREVVDPSARPPNSSSWSCSPAGGCGNNSIA